MFILLLLNPLSGSISYASNETSLMVCSHCPTPRLINRPIKMGCTELCGGVHTVQRQTLTQGHIWLLC